MSDLLPNNDFGSARQAEAPASATVVPPKPAAGVGALSLEDHARQAAAFGAFMSFYRLRTSAEKRMLRAAMPEHCPK